MQNAMTLFNSDAIMLGAIRNALKPKRLSWQIDYAKPEEKLDFTDYDNRKREELIDDLSRDIQVLEKKATFINHSLKLAMKAKRRWF